MNSNAVLKAEVFEDVELAIGNGDALGRQILPTRFEVVEHAITVGKDAANQDENVPFGKQLQQAHRKMLMPVYERVCKTTRKLDVIFQYEVDKQKNLDTVSTTNFAQLFETLHSILTSSAQSLKQDQTAENTQRVMFEVLNRTTDLIADLKLSQFPELPNEPRKATVKVYAKLAKLLRRNSIDALSGDARGIVGKLADAGRISTNGLRGRGSDAENWVKTEVFPKVDADLELGLFNVNTYNHKPIVKIYKTLGMWRHWKTNSTISRFFASR